MAVGGVTAAILDNLLPGTKDERGLNAWKSTKNFDNKSSEIYDLPFVQEFLNRSRWARYVPFLPYHGDEEQEEQKEDINDKRRPLNEQKHHQLTDVTKL